MADLLGVQLPTIQVTGFLSSTWFYVLIVFIIGAILVTTLILVLHYRTWNKKIEFFDNVGGRGYQRIATKRARSIKLGKSGSEVLKAKGYAHFLPAYGRKMGRNTYWFAKGLDGYYYNVVLGDLDGKMNMLDVEPIDRDVRMFHVAMDRITQNLYGDQKGFLEKYAPYMFLFMFFLLMVGSMWLIVGRVGEAIQQDVKTAETNERVANLLAEILKGADNIATRQDSGGSVSGLVPANLTNT